jgi:hypothetical protein
MASLGSEVDHVVGGLGHVQVVFDQQNGVAGVDQPIQGLDQARCQCCDRD